VCEFGLFETVRLPDIQLPIITNIGPISPAAVADGGLPDIRFDAFSGMPVRRRPPGGVETSKAERTSGNSGAPFRHTAVVAAGAVRYPADLETAVECIPRPRPMSSLRTTTKPGELRVF
jgi:hypothetical protein